MPGERVKSDGMNCEIPYYSAISAALYTPSCGSSGTRTKELPPLAGEPPHPSLEYKKVHPIEPIYSVRVGSDWRALGQRKGEHLYLVLDWLALGFR